jgi:hypothetical protein
MLSVTYLSKDASFTRFVLGDFMYRVLSAIFTFAEGTTSLGNVDYTSALYMQKLVVNNAPMAC